MREQRRGSERAGRETIPTHLRGALRERSNFDVSDAKILARLSPSALARWPTVARQMSDAGVLDSASGESLVRYCEAFAKWCQAGDQLAMMLIDLGLTANCLKNAPTKDRQNSPKPAADGESKSEPNRRPPNSIMRRAEVEREIGLSRSTIYQRIRAGTFPPPVRLGPRSVGWRLADIEAFLVSPADYEAPKGGV